MPEVPGNFTRLVLNGAFTKLAEQLISPKVTLPWLFQLLSVPSGLLGLIVPIRDTGSLLPQLTIAGVIRSSQQRKWYWVTAALVQALTLFGAILALSWDSGLWSGLWILFMLLIFSLASGVGSVAFKDVAAKVIPSGQRGQMLAARSWIGGALGLAAGIALLFGVDERTDDLFLILFILAGVLWFLGALTYATVREFKGETQGGRTPIQTWKKGVEIFRLESNFRRFIYARASLMSIPLAVPFFVAQGRSEVSETFSHLGLIIIATGLAQVLSSSIWGKWSDKSAKTSMQVAGAIGLISIIYVITFPFWPGSFQSVWALAPVFFINGSAYAGAKIGRKTYLIDMAPEDERSTWVSMANTSMGVVTIVAGGIGLLGSVWGIEIQLALYGGFSLLSIFLASRLSDV